MYIKDKLSHYTYTHCLEITVRPSYSNRPREFTTLLYRLDHDSSILAILRGQADSREAQVNSRYCYSRLRDIVDPEYFYVSCIKRTKQY